MADNRGGYDHLVASTSRYYDARQKEHGPGPRGVDWKDRASQHLRFEIVARYVDWRETPVVLDVGCGDGEWVRYCAERDLRQEYRGIDVSPVMVAAARRRHPELEGRFVARSAMEEVTVIARSSLRPDWVIASGAFNVKQDAPTPAWRAHVHDTVRALFAVARRGVVFNVMSQLVDYSYDHLYYASCDEIEDLATSCGTRDFVIDQTYSLFEMTVALLKRDIDLK